MHKDYTKCKKTSAITYYKEKDEKWYCIKNKMNV